MAKRRRKGCLFFVILVTVSVGAYLTNPTEKMHQAAAKEKFIQLADNLLSAYGIEKSLIARLGIDLSGQFVDDFIESHIDGGMKSCRLRAISCQVTLKLKRATTLE